MYFSCQKDYIVLIGMDRLSDNRLDDLLHARGCNSYYYSLAGALT